MRTININFGKEYLFVHPATSEAVIMKVENLGVEKRTRYSLRFKVQNYIQREGGEWEKIQMEDFNKLGLHLICEYDPKPVSIYEESLEIIRKAAIEIGCHKFEVEDAEPDDLCSLIESELEAINSEESNA